MGKIFFNIGKTTPDVVVSSDGLRDPLRVRTTQALGGFGALPPYFLLRDTDGVQTADADEIRAKMASVGTVSSVMPLRLKRPTDGVTECKNERGEMFGEDKVVRTLSYSRTADDFIKNLEKNLKTFSKDLNDDITAIAFDL